MPTPPSTTSPPSDTNLFLADRKQWLGVAPPPKAITGSPVKFLWVKGLFDRLPAEATPEVVTFHTRAFTWVLVAGVLLANRSGDHILVHILPLNGHPTVASTYSWGSAVLAWLYKVMGRAVFFTGGSLRGTGDIGLGRRGCHSGASSHQ
ncbi:Protein MAIN-LIKE 2 [Linum perenne]